MKEGTNYRRSVAVRGEMVLLLVSVLGLVIQDTAFPVDPIAWPTLLGAEMAASISLAQADTTIRVRGAKNLSEKSADPPPPLPSPFEGEGEGGGPSISRIGSKADRKFPLYFEANRGQSDPQVKFLSRSGGYSLFLTPMEAVLCLHRGSRDVRTMLRIHLLDARPTSQLEGLELLPGKSHYFIGNDPGRWRTGIPHYARVKYREIYPQIDLIFYGNQGQVEYDFVVAPGADPKAIRLGFEGADHLSLDGQGNLILHTAGGQLLQRAPVIYQEINGTRRAIPGRYVLLECKGCQPGQGTQPVGFEVAAHDSTRPLIIERTPNPIPVLHLGSPQEALPLTLKPKQTLEVVFEVTFDCANDRAKSTPTNPRHADYRYVAVVDRKALDGAADSHPVDDLCPRSVTPPFEVDPNPDGKIKDRGCGEQKADKTLGADLLTDVVVK